MQALRARLEAAGVSGFLVVSLPNIRYLTGFTGSNALLLVEAGQAWLWTDSRYREQAAQEVRGAQVRIPPKGDLWQAAAPRLRRHGRRLAVEADHISMTQGERLREWAADARGVRGWVEELRAIKTPEEVAAIERAIQLASSVLEPTLKKLKPGITEIALAAELEYRLRRAGGEGTSFDTIVASGPHSALVHGRASSKAIEAQEFVLMDYGVILGGYVSDMTRTVFLGRPSRRAREVYGIVLEAQLAAIAAVAPGVKTAAVDRAARQVIARAGLGEAFAHSTGHGLGLEVHEQPRLSRLSQQVLQPGHVITIEPGVYLPGWGGVRIEDVVLVTETGARVLTPSPKQFRAL